MCALTETYETQQGWERSLEGGMIDIETRQWARECHREREGGRERKGESKATISQMIPPPPLSGLLGCQWMPLLPEPSLSLLVPTQMNTVLSSSCCSLLQPLMLPKKRVLLLLLVVL